MKMPVIFSLVTVILAACAVNKPQTVDALLTSGITGPQFCLIEPAEVVALKVSKYFDGCFINSFPTEGYGYSGFGTTFLNQGKHSSLTNILITNALDNTTAQTGSSSYQFSMKPTEQGFQGSVYFNAKETFESFKISGYVMTVAIIAKNEPGCQTLIRQTAVKDASHPFEQFELAVRTGKRPKGCRCMTENCD